MLNAGTSLGSATQTNRCPCTQSRSGVSSRASPAMPPAKAGAEPAAEPIQPDPAWTNLGRSLWFDPKAEATLLRARVVLRDGYLEHLMCSKGTKEHEAILATDAVPNQIHAGLLLTGADPGHPVQFVPKFEPPTGRRSRSNCVDPGRQAAQAGRSPVGQGRDEGNRWRATGFSPAASFTKTPSPRKNDTPPMTAT